jgi:hypothetical protein
VGIDAAALISRDDGSQQESNRFASSIARIENKVKK